MQRGLGLTYWDHEKEEGISDEKIAALWAQPGCADACRALIRQAQGLTKKDSVFHANFRDIGRMVLGTLALYLHATGGLTHRRLCELSSEGGVLSSGRASAILLRLRMIGYVKPSDQRSDGSARLYVPTEKMIGAYAARTQLELDALAKVEPDMAPFMAFWERDRHAALFALYHQIGERLTYATNNTRQDLKPFEALIMRDAGMLMFYAVLESADRGGAFPQVGPFAISLADMSRRFGVSRTHVLRFFRDAEKAGYLARDAKDNLTVVTSALCKAFADYYATIQIALMVMAYRALKDLEREKAA
jgi:AraC-like DNA-binding protein